jgi:hypothetical protein
MTKILILSPTRNASLRELGEALDRAEATVPALHRLRSRYDGHRFFFPNHPAVRAYRDLAMTLAAFDSPEPPGDSRELNSHIKMARKDLRELREIFDNRAAMRGQPGIQWPDGGKSVSLRALLDVYADMMAAQGDLERLVNFRAGQKQRQIMEHREKLRRDGRALARAIKQAMGGL